MNMIRHFFIRSVLPKVWRSSRQRMVSGLQEISITELDSAWQSLYAADHIRDPQIQAMLFQHAMEEVMHAELFDDLCKRYSDLPLNVPVYSRQIIMNAADEKNGLIDFLTYMHVGEREVNNDFVVYSATDVDKRIRNLFQMIKRDEVFHERDSLEMIEKVAGPARSKARYYIWKNGVLRNYRQVSAVFAKFGELPLKLLLSILYFGFGSVLSFAFRSRLELSRSEQLRILREQCRTMPKELSS